MEYFTSSVKQDIKTPTLIHFLEIKAPAWAYIIVTTKEAGGGKKDWRMGGYIRIELDGAGKPKYILEDMYDGEIYEVKSCKDVQNAVVKCGAKEIKRKRALNK